MVTVEMTGMTIAVMTKADDTAITMTDAVQAGATTVVSAEDVTPIALTKTGETENAPTRPITWIAVPGCDPGRALIPDLDHDHLSKIDALDPTHTKEAAPIHVHNLNLKRQIRRECPQCENYPRGRGPSDFVSHLSKSSKRFL